MYHRGNLQQARVTHKLPGRFARGASLAPVVYTATFATENPLSDGSRWVQGATNGTSWQNVQSTSTAPARAYGVGASAGYDDCIAHVSPLVGIASTHHYAEATCYRAGGYTPPSSHECELFAACTITSGNIVGYEAVWGFGVALAFVRWNGPIGNFTVQGSANDNLSTGKGWTDTATGTGGAALVDGDVARVEFTIVNGSPLLIGYRNGVEVLRAADTSAYKITSGQPGMAFFARSGAGLVMDSYCWKAYSAGTL